MQNVPGGGSISHLKLVLRGLWMTKLYYHTNNKSAYQIKYCVKPSSSSYTHTLLRTNHLCLKTSVKVLLKMQLKNFFKQKKNRIDDKVSSLIAHINGLASFIVCVFTFLVSRESCIDYDRYRFSKNKRDCGRGRQ